MLIHGCSHSRQHCTQQARQVEAQCRHRKQQLGALRAGGNVFKVRVQKRTSSTATALLLQNRFACTPSKAKQHNCPTHSSKGEALRGGQRGLAPLCPLLGRRCLLRQDLQRPGLHRRHCLFAQQRI